jgi:hypothetical protein
LPKRIEPNPVYENFLKKLQRDAFDLLGLSEAERKVMIATRLSKTISGIAFQTKIPQTSILYMLKKLEKRGLVMRVGEGHKNVRWASNLRGALRLFALYNHHLTRRF